MSMCINQIEKSHHRKDTPRIEIKQEIHALASQKDKFHMAMLQLRSAQLSSAQLNVPHLFAISATEEGANHTTRAILTSRVVIQNTQEN